MVFASSVVGNSGDEFALDFRGGGGGGVVFRVG